MINIIILMPTVSIALLQSSSGQKCKTAKYNYTLNCTVGVSNALGCVVDTNRLHAYSQLWCRSPNCWWGLFK